VKIKYINRDKDLFGFTKTVPSAKARIAELHILRTPSVRVFFLGRVTNQLAMLAMRLLEHPHLEPNS